MPWHLPSLTLTKTNVQSFPPSHAFATDSNKVVINTIMPPNTITLKKSQVRVQFKWEVLNTQWRIGIAMPKKRERLHQEMEKIRSYQGKFFL